MKLHRSCLVFASSSSSVQSRGAPEQKSKGYKMTLASLFALVGLLALSASAQTWTNGTVMTFTNLLGRDYKSVTLSRCDAYGIVWSGDSGGVSIPS